MSLKSDSRTDVSDCALPEIEDDDSIHLLCNAEQIYYGRLPSAQIPKWLDVGSAIKLSISQVSTPYKFWFQLYLHSSDMKDFMNSINVFYKNLDHSQLLMSKQVMKVDRICVALYKKRWHRAKIVDVTTIDFNKVKIFYVDYGTTEFVSTSDIRFMHEIFSEYPIQAFRGCLDNIQPIDNVWPYSATTHFFRLTNNHPIFGRITAINATDQVFYMNLFDVVNGVDINVARVLIENNFASFVHSSIYTNVSRNKDAYPTFEMLEYGKYPSFKELSKMHKF